MLNKTGKYFPRFQVDVEFLVKHNAFSEIGLIFNPDFDYEQSVWLASSTPMPCEDWEIGIWLAVDCVSFAEPDHVAYTFRYEENTRPGTKNQTEFMELLLLFAWFGFKVDVRKSNSPKLAETINRTLEQLEKKDSTSEIDMFEFFGVFF